ncbi:MAG TPA: polyprenyl diphosphate synthase [Candidatus Limnocylindrales bacterium]|nr:polyprenyl diphosphate synthase [Candidatus Limnocylindrales bacterium]
MRPLDRWLGPLYRLYAWRLWSRVHHGPVPRHLALILDGNRRFVERTNLISIRDGYRAGAKRADVVLDWCERAGIQAVTLWVMSLDNLERDDEHVRALTGVLEDEIRLLTETAKRRGWRLRAIGRLRALPRSLCEVLETAERETEGNRATLTVQFAVAYGGREEIVDALQRWAGDAGVSGLPVGEALTRLRPDDLNPHLYGADLPDPDLILRTSGEIRLSGFLLWQSVYSEYYFSDVLWPEFREIDFLRALRSYQGRTRRFGR